MYVEFIGPPGAGKTTLLPAAAEALEERGLTAFTVVEAARPFARRTTSGAIVATLAPGPWRDAILWRVFAAQSAIGRQRFFAAHKLLRRLVRVSQQGRPVAADGRRRRVLHWYYRHAGAYQFLSDQARSDEAILFDEGFLHRVVQLFTSPVERPSAATVSEYVALLPVPDLTIAVLAPAAICEQRIYDRGLWHRLSHKSRQEIGNFVLNAHATVEMALAAAREAGWPVIEVDNGANDPASSAACLQESLTGYPLPAARNATSRVRTA